MSCFIKKVFDWLNSEGKKDLQKIATVAVHITEDVKKILDSDVTKWLVGAVELAFPTVKNLPEVILVGAQKVITKALAVEYGIIGFPDNPTAEDRQKLVDTILSTAGVKVDKSKLYSTICADVIGILQEYEGHPVHTFAERVEEGEKVFQTIKADIDAYNAEAA